MDGPKETPEMFNLRIAEAIKEAEEHKRQKDRRAAMLEHCAIQLLKELMHVDYSTNAALMAERAVHFADELIKALENKNSNG